MKQREDVLYKLLKENDVLKIQIKQKDEQIKRQNDFTLELMEKKIEIEKSMLSMEKQLDNMEKYHIIMKNISSFLLFSMETEASSMFKAMRVMLACHFNTENFKCP